MKINKKRFLSIVASLFVCFTASAFDWGGIFKNSTGLSLPNFSNAGLSQTDGLYLWMNTPLANSELSLSGEVMYQFGLNADQNGNTVSNLADLDLLKVAGDYDLNSGILSISFGRFAVADITSVIFMQSIDGAFVKYVADLFNISAYAGYTGLLNGLNVTMINGDAQVFENSNSVYSLANPFIPLSLTLEFPALLGNQTLALQANGYLDLGVNRISRYYATLLADGPITDSLFYSVSTTIGSSNFQNIMNYSTASLYYYPLDMFFLSTGVEYASGKNGSLSPFVGITSRAIVNSLESKQTSGIVLPKLSVNVIVGKILVSVNGKYLLSVLDSSSEGNGFEADLSLLYSPYSDLQVGLDVTSYFDTTKDKNNNNFTATLKVALSF